MFEVIPASSGRVIKAWKKGLEFEAKAVEQLQATARLPFIFRHIAAMPDCHWGQGSTVGTVLPTLGAVCPAAVGVDIEVVMAAQADLVRPLQRLKQFLCVKGAK